VLIARVHWERILPPDLQARGNGLWKERYELIGDFERLLEQNGTKVLKFFLHISKDEQRERLQDRQRDRAARNINAAKSLVHHPGGPQVGAELLDQPHHRKRDGKNADEVSARGG
jgi:hypothetical protein